MVTIHHFQAVDLIGGRDSFETHVVEYCTQLSKRSWCRGDKLLKAGADSRHLTLLHLAAALGCTKLITTLVQWRYVLECTCMYTLVKVARTNYK